MTSALSSTTSNLKHFKNSMSLTSVRLDNQEADILCPPVIRQNDESGSRDHSFDGLTNVKQGVLEHSASRPTSGRFAIIRYDLNKWAREWYYAILGDKSNTNGPRTPIPFDQMIFAKLDAKISFDDEKPTDVGPGMVSASETDDELRHEPDHAITHSQAPRVVMPHHSLRAWEDIPPYQRSRGYNDQPAYTDDYDDFLWLPRDPLSTLDLDDTVEMRLSLTTSAGGSGRIGDWPESDDNSEIVMIDVERWPDHQTAQPTDRETPRVSPESSDESPRATSERRLLERIELSEHIGSEVDEGSGSVLLARRLSRFFHRSGTASDATDSGISMQTLSVSPNPALEGRSGSSSSAPRRNPSDDVELLSTSRTSSPLQMTVRQDPSTSHTQSSTISFPSELGRSPSGRRPSQIRSSSKTSDGGLRSPNMHHRSSSRRDRSTSVLSAQRQALIDEVMEEERVASKHSRKEEKEESQKEAGEVQKEQESLRRSNKVEEGSLRAGRPEGPVRGVSEGGSVASTVRA